MEFQISTTRLIIRPFVAEDLPMFTQYRNDPIIAKYQSWTDYSFEQAQSFFAGMDYKAFGQSGLWFQLAIADKQTQLIMGDIALHFIDDEQMEIGFTLAQQYQQQGIAFEAVSAVINYLFIELKKHRIIATTDAENIPSMALLNKLGFRKEGHFIKNIFFKGQWGDECAFAMLRDEYISNANSKVEG